MLETLVQTNRSYRRFDASVAVSQQQLVDLVRLARLCPSAANRQPIRFILSTSPTDNAVIFSCLKWAAYLTDWDGPAEHERPTAYIVMVNTIKSWDFAKYDLGIMAQTMLLGAVEKGLGGCMIGAIDRPRLSAHFMLEADTEIGLIVALGKPIEEIHIEDVREEGSIRYYRDETGRHHVPKHTLETLIRARKN